MMIGKKIKERREELGLSQEQLAKMIGVGKSAVGNYETNISSPKETVLLKIFTALKCDANYLYEDFLKHDDNLEITSSEKKHIKKYRALDEYGQKAVDSALDIQYERCVKESEQKSITVEKTYPAELIAHDGINRKTEVTEQDLINAIKADRALRKKP